MNGVRHVEGQGVKPSKEARAAAAGRAGAEGIRRSVIGARSASAAAAATSASQVRTTRSPGRAPMIRRAAACVPGRWPQPTGLSAGAYGLGNRRHATADRRGRLVGVAPEVLFEEVAQVVADVLGADAVRCVGVAVAYPGMLDESRGTVLASLVLDRTEPLEVTTALHEVLVRRLPGLAARTDRLHVRLVRDATAIGLGEYLPGGRGEDPFEDSVRPHSLLAISGERHGLGAALIGGAGRAQALEIGHLSVAPDGPRCPCGSRGCLELYLGGPALTAALGVDAVDRLEEPALHRALADALATSEETGRLADLLGVAITGTVNTLGPDEVVLTGLLGLLARAAPAHIDAALDASVVARVRGTRWRTGSVGDACRAGAAQLALQPLLDDPGTWRGKAGDAAPAAADS